MDNHGAIHRYEDLEIWKRSMELSVQVYAALRTVHDFGLRDQMQRAAVSVPSNIAEGYERGANKEFVQYLRIAKGSLGELRTQVILAQRVGVLDQASAERFSAETRQISAMIASLIQVRQTRF